MKVQQLFLRNVRSIKSLDLDFRDPVTGKPMSRIVLAGANGSGKTTILECLFELLSAAGRYGEARVKFPSYFLDAYLKLIFEVDFPGNMSAILSVSYGADEQTRSDIPGGQRRQLKDRASRYEYLETLSKDAPEAPTSRFNQLTEMIGRAANREGEGVGSILYFPHSRSLPAIPQGELGFEPKLYQWTYKYEAWGEWKGSIESYLFSLNYLDLEDRDRRMTANRFGQTVELVNSILVDKRIARIEKGRVVVETTSGQTHGLNDLSSGEKQLVLMLIEIARRVVPGSVILIDEPEISLHPTWQRGLFAALDKIIEQYDAQVILATHSLEIATSVMPEEVISLSDLDNLPRGEWKPEKEALG